MPSRTGVPPGFAARTVLRPYALPGIMRPLAQALPLSHPVGGTRLSRRGARRYNECMGDTKLSHLDSHGKARMVDVGAKDHSERWAVARGTVTMSRETLAAARNGDLRKGDLRSTAELAGVMAAKRAWELIPLCHPIPLDHVEVRLDFREELPGVEITATARAKARTGVEMEALAAVAVAALTVYDMVKAIEKGARISDIRLVEKHGGRSGDYIGE